MTEIHFHYTSNPNAGDLDISVGIDPSYFERPHHYEFEDRSTIESSKTPLQLLNDLEKSVVQSTGQKPGTRDMWDDEYPDSKDLPRSFGYLVSSTWSGLGDEEDPKERAEVDAKNQSRHQKAFDAYREFVSRLQ